MPKLLTNLLVVLMLGTPLACGKKAQPAVVVPQIDRSAELSLAPVMQDGVSIGRSQVMISGRPCVIFHGIQKSPLEPEELLFAEGELTRLLIQQGNKFEQGRFFDDGTKWVTKQKEVPSYNCLTYAFHWLGLNIDDWIEIGITPDSNGVNTARVILQTYYKPVYSTVPATQSQAVLYTVDPTIKEGDLIMMTFQNGLIAHAGVFYKVNVHDPNSRDSEFQIGLKSSDQNWVVSKLARKQLTITTLQTLHLYYNSIVTHYEVWRLKAIP